MFAGDIDLFVEVAMVFVATWPEIEAALKEAVSTGEREEIRRGAHRIRGSISYFDKPEETEIARKLEEESGGLADSEVEQLASRLRFQVSLLCEELERAAGAHAASKSLAS